MMTFLAEEGSMDQEASKDQPADSPRPECITFKVARFLQDSNPRKEITAGAAAKGAGISQGQASHVLSTFARERTDVVRVRRGVYKYVPGKGKGIRPGLGTAELDIEGPAVNNPSDGIRTFYSGGVIKGIGMTLPVIPREPAPLSFTQVPGLSTVDGHFVARDEGGVVYKVIPLS